MKIIFLSLFLTLLAAKAVVKPVPAPVSRGCSEGINSKGAPFCYCSFEVPPSSINPTPVDQVCEFKSACKDRKEGCAETCSFVYRYPPTCIIMKRTLVSCPPPVYKDGGTILCTDCQWVYIDCVSQPNANIEQCLRDVIYCENNQEK